MFYVILDAAVMGSGIYEAGNLSLKCSSLFMGEAGEKLKYVAPYLMQYAVTSEFREFIGELMNNNNCGIFLESDRPFEDVYRHFRRFLYVKTEAGKQMYFRYYDPRILPTFLETCTIDQLDLFFGKVLCFEIYSKESGSKLYFLDENRKLSHSHSFDYLTIKN